jgi:hypothetical protein
MSLALAVSAGDSCSVYIRPRRLGPVQGSIVETNSTTQMGGEDHTGKRGAVRNNSGEPVDHSGPDLGVGPTTPATAGRKPEACPPISDISQDKSGRGSGGGTPGAASEASGVLRSEATQWSSSLDEIQSNRNTDFPSSFKSLRRGKHCGAWTVWGTTPDGLRRIFHRVNCKTWGCCYCGPRKAKRYRYLICQVAEREQLTRFLTLTLDPSLIEGDSVRYLRRVFDKFRIYLRRRFGNPVKYIAVLEFHKSRIAHLHLLVDRFIPWEWIKDSWSALGGGTVVDVRFVDVHRISRYLSKYLTKELLQSAPARSRRVTTSRLIRLVEKKKDQAVWILLKLSIFFLYSRHWRDAQEVSLDEEGMLQSFALELV